jgi:Flp pilus assembly protein TadD/ketosteroid isomerase-like protein
MLVLAAMLVAGGAQADDYRTVRELLRDGKLTEAQARVDRHLAARPRDAQMRFFRGVIQRESGRTAEATATFTRLTEDHPELPEPYNNLAVIYAAQGQYDKARIALEKALRTNPSYATAHDNLADIYARLASQAYSKALQIETAGATAPAPARLALIRDLATTPGGQPQPDAATARTLPAPSIAPAPVKPAVVAVAPASLPRPAAPATSAPPPSGDARLDVEQAVRAWARAWAARDMPAYLSAYSQDFHTPGQLPRKAWEEDRRLRIMGKSRISVTLLELQITVQGDRAVAKFRQDYKADALAVLSRKTLELGKTGGRWLILKESSGG